MKACIETSRSTSSLVLIAALLIVIAGFRPIGVDGDSLNYVSTLDVPITEANFLDKEPFYWIIVCINQLLFSANTQAFFFIFASIGVSLKFFAINRLALLPMLSVVAYISLYFILHEMTQIRAGVAAAIFLLAIPDIINRNVLAYFIKTIFACLFHYSAVGMLLIYFLRPTVFRQSFYLILPVVGMMLGLLNGVTLRGIDFLINLLPDFMSSKLNLYIVLLSKGEQIGINAFNFYYISLLMLYFFMVINYKKFKSEFDGVLLKIFGLMLFLFYLLSVIPVLAFRISEFFGVVLIILIPHVILLFREKIVILIPVFGWLAVYFFVIMVGENLNF